MQPVNYMQGLGSFQFHKGTIKPYVKASVMLLNSHFNSIKVRLNPSVRLYSYARELFQFHKGTIKPKVFFNGQYRYSDFNSIKVRLNRC